MTADSVNVTVYGKYRDGVFVLNEGNMTSENGFLTFISPKGEVTDSVYYKVNGSSLGNVTQSLFIADKKMYIISQNGNRMNGDGLLVVADAETLKKVAAYNDELADLSWPTHGHQSIVYPMMKAVCQIRCTIESETECLFEEVEIMSCPRRIGQYQCYHNAYSEYQPARFFLIDEMLYWGYHSIYRVLFFFIHYYCL